MLTHPNQIRSVERWVWSELHELPDGEWRPVAEEFCLWYDAPFHFSDTHGRFALCCCQMLHDHYEAALFDERLFVLDDLHSEDPIPEIMAIALGPLFRVSLKDTVRNTLVKLSAVHLHYLPKH